MSLYYVTINYVCDVTVNYVCMWCRIGDGDLLKLSRPESNVGSLCTCLSLSENRNMDWIDMFMYTYGRLQYDCTENK